LILNSKTYQLSSLGRGAKPEAEANFAFYPLRRLDAEVLIDAICQVTGTTEKYTSAIPEPFTFLPEGHRSIALPDGSITSAFLEEFGRPPRDTGLESERNNRTTASQRLEMLNSTHIQRKLEQSPRLQALLAAGQTPRQMIESLYLTILSRFPTDEELKIALRYLNTGKRGRREAIIDLAWALVNSAEFMYRH
jgi:myosin-crossreactive antigen